MVLHISLHNGSNDAIGLPCCGPLRSSKWAHCCVQWELLWSIICTIDTNTQFVTGTALKRNQNDQTAQVSGETVVARIPANEELGCEQRGVVKLMRSNKVLASFFQQFKDPDWTSPLHLRCSTTSPGLIGGNACSLKGESAAHASKGETTALKFLPRSAGAGDHAAVRSS